MSSAAASPSHVVVSHSYAMDKHLPSKGEIILVRLSQDLFGPGSTGIVGSVPSRSTRRNYHHAIVLNIRLHPYESLISSTVCPMPAYSSTDPESGLSSTRWLLNQPDDYQQLHIPVPYEEASTLTQSNPPFSTPAQFGDPLLIGGWKDRRPSWIQAVPQVAKMKYTTRFNCYEPPVKLSTDEVRRLNEYWSLFAPPVFSDVSIMPPSLPGGGDAAAAEPEVSPSGGEAVAGGSLLPIQLGGSNQQGRAVLPANRSLAFQALYSNDAVKCAFAALDRERHSVKLYSSSDDDSDDDDEVWEDNMDPITFARYYAAADPRLARIVQEHDKKMRDRLNQGIMSWVEEIQSEKSEWGAS
ncbi:hypothetical protein D9615_001520 [Tricholomella constricta]|uniref:Uncharacterized protein n=1 Tax=Tricholomella constricta TaxID=117010 RepID=A0A8H5HNJ0_9AGAR|nr:hypothetical protein D9615_001520 [Tricholomella constricta]